MRGLIMDYQLTLPAILRRAETLFGDVEVITQNPDKSVHRYNYREMARRAKQLSLALGTLGVSEADRVGTFCWNHYRHLEAYFGIPACGAVLHTLNLRLHPDDLTFIANHADDKVVIVDDVLWPLFEKFRDRLNAEHVVVITHGGKAPAGAIDYEELISRANADDYRDLELDERQAAAMCYTSGTTGKPKGVLYSHRALVLHSLASTSIDMLAVSEADVTCPVVPMFHANAWAIPYVAALAGASQVFPGPFLDPPSLLDLFQTHRVTLTAGVPTIWLGILQLLDANPNKYDLSAMKKLIVGGSAAPAAMIEGFQERHGLSIVQAWGMTELSPMGTVSNLPHRLAKADRATQYKHRAKQGLAAPFVEIRGRNADGLIPWDGEATGELEVRGPWISNAYFKPVEPIDSFTEDGWFRTGDIVSIDRFGVIEIKDRAKDVIKSGGEWISSVQIENALIGHSAVAEAAVIAIPCPKWQERPLAVVVLKKDQRATEEDLIAHLSTQFAKWWLPDGVVFIDEIPRTSTGKFQKIALRERFKEHRVSRAPTR